MADKPLVNFDCTRCGKPGTELDGTPCEGCGKGICLDCVATETTCPSCGLCALCGADPAAGETHDLTRHDKF